MFARTQLAVLDHNCNIDRKQAVNKRNELQTKSQYSKVSGQWVAKKVMEKKYRGYIADIIVEIPKVKTVPLERNEKLETIPRNIGTTPNPGKLEILSSKILRFSKDCKH